MMNLLLLAQAHGCCDPTLLLFAVAVALVLVAGRALVEWLWRQATHRPEELP